jgi:mannose-6-phosphate isomerase
MHPKAALRRNPKDKTMTDKQLSLYPLRFEPLFQYRLWGGRRLADLLSAPLPDGPIGEAWLLSDRDDHPSRVAEGPLKGRTLGELMTQSPEQLLGNLAGRFRRFPLLLKFLDVQKSLSVQVHPSDRLTDYIPAGESGKTEAWVVLEAGPDSRIYAGLRPGTTDTDLRQVIAGKTVADDLAGFHPSLGDAVLVRAGTVHSLGDVVVFELQENSDVTFRLYDWDHVDPKTGEHRPLQVEQALACIDLAQVAVGPVVPVVEAPAPVRRERLILCEHFGMWRIQADSPFTVGAAGTPRVLVCLEGEGRLEYEKTHSAVAKGDTVLLPAVVGACVFQPSGAVNILEISLPEGK